MSDAIRTATAPVAERQRDKDRILEGLSRFLSGITPERGAEVQLSVPGVGTLVNDALYKSLMRDENRRRALACYLRALLEVQELAKRENISLADAAFRHAEACRKTLEGAWVRLLEDNRDKEQSIRWTAQFFSNLDSSVGEFKGKIAFLDLSADELCTDKGIEGLTEVLSSLADYPDARNAYGYVVVRGSSADPASLNKLGQRVHSACAVLITDAPEFERLEDLRLAAEPGALLEGYAGEEPRHRHMVLLGGRGVARKAFSGRSAKETKPVFVEASGPWFGHYLHNIKQNRPWLPHVGFSNPIVGMEGVELGLRLGGEANIKLFGKHRINPLILRSAESTDVLVWGADTLSKADRGVQIGVGVVEMLLLRYADYVVKKEGILNDLESGQKRLKDTLTEFLNENSGARKMFRAGSRVLVGVDYEKKSYDITFEVEFRQLGEKAFLRMTGTNSGPDKIETTKTR